YPLEAHIDEVVVRRVRLRPRNWRTEHLQSATRLERLPVVDRLAVERVWRDRLNEGQDVGVFRGTDSGGLAFELIVRRRENAAVDAGVREDVRVEQVDQRWSLTLAQLDDQALIHLHWTTQEREQS